MTLPRPNPDNPRIDAETKAWIIAAGKAGASAWQTAVYAQRPIDTVYTLWRRAMIERRKRPERRKQYPRPSRAKAKLPSLACPECGFRGQWRTA